MTTRASWALSLSAAAAMVASAAAQVGPPPSSCSGTPNTIPVWTGTATPVANVTNGRKLLADPGGGYEAPLILVHLYGTDYEMGYAYGSLLKTELATLIPLVMAYLDAQVNASLNWLNPSISGAVAEYGLVWALNATWAWTQPYTPPWWEPLLRGMADGSGLDFYSLVQLNMLPELIKAQCSIVGAWGAATPGGDLVQLRALDWDTDGPFQMFPVLATFHPAPGTGFTHTTMSWAGLVGAITGYSSSGLAISEKVWDAYSGLRNSFGYPFTFLLQDILRFDLDTDRALSRIASANRTCSIWIGLGDAYANSFKIVAYSNQQVDVINTRNFVPYTNHDAFVDLLYTNKHVQPSTEPCMNDVLHWGYGNVTASFLSTYLVALEQTGDMHIAIYDFVREVMYVSNASPGDGSGNGVVPAYNRQFLRFNMTDMWATPAPPMMVAAAAAAVQA
jgi:isopenicillin-N N-acyltransferase like protein